jgi:hypothetical protein
MAIDTPDPHEAMKRELANRTRRMQAEHTARQLTNQRDHDRAASDKARTADREESRGN